MSKEVKKLPKRSEVKVEDTWRVEDIFATDELWEVELAELKELVPTVGQFAGKLGESAATLLEALKHVYGVVERVGRLYVYSSLRSDQDTANSFHQSQKIRATTLYSEFGAATSYLDPELLAIDEDKLNGFIESNDELKVYAHYFEKLLLTKPHKLSAEQEAILAQVTDVTGSSANSFGMLNNADLKFPTIEDENGNLVEITHGNYIQFLESTNRDVRKRAAEAVTSTYQSYKNTFASTLAGAVKSDNFFAKVRNYDSARHAAMSKNNIPEAVHDQLVETVNENLHLVHRYMKLRKKMLKLDEMYSYDLMTPLLPETKMTVTYEESVQLVKESLKIMGEEYSAAVEEGFAERWVDVYENEGKRSGAYSSGTYGTSPYILMNWTDTVNDLFTLTHEFGHSVHSYLSRKYQPYIYGGYSIFVAEVASTCNEALLNHYMLAKTTDKNDRLYLLNNFLDGFHGTVVRQVMFAEFEHKIHQMARNGEALTPDAMSDVYFELNKKYSGPDVIVTEETSVQWARIPHFYYNYYVYQYATGYAAAQALSKLILEEGAPAAERYITEFLKAGNSDYPIEVLKKAGVDMTSKAPIEGAFKVFEQYLEQMEALVD